MGRDSRIRARTNTGFRYGPRVVLLVVVPVDIILSVASASPDSSRHTASCPTARSARSSSSACARRVSWCNCPRAAGRPVARTVPGSSGSRPPRIPRGTACWRSVADAEIWRSRRTRPCLPETCGRPPSRRRTRRISRSSGSGSSARTWCTVPPETSTPFSSSESKTHGRALERELAKSLQGVIPYLYAKLEYTLVALVIPRRKARCRKYCRRRRSRTRPLWRLPVSTANRDSYSTPLAASRPSSACISPAWELRDDIARDISRDRQGFVCRVKLITYRSSDRISNSFVLTAWWLAWWRRLHPRWRASARSSPASGCAPSSWVRESARVFGKSALWCTGVLRKFLWKLPRDARGTIGERVVPFYAAVSREVAVAVEASNGFSWPSRRSCLAGWWVPVRASSLLPGSGRSRFVLGTRRTGSARGIISY